MFGLLAGLVMYALLRLYFDKSVDGVFFFFLDILPYLLYMNMNISFTPLLIKFLLCRYKENYYLLISLRFQATKRAYFGIFNIVSHHLRVEINVSLYIFFSSNSLRRILRTKLRRSFEFQSRQ